MKNLSWKWFVIVLYSLVCGGKKCHCHASPQTGVAMTELFFTPSNFHLLICSYICNSRNCSELSKIPLASSYQKCYTLKSSVEEDRIRKALPREAGRVLRVCRWVPEETASEPRVRKPFGASTPRLCPATVGYE